MKRTIITDLNQNEFNQNSQKVLLTNNKTFNLKSSNIITDNLTTSNNNSNILRPKTLSTYIGQESLKKILNVSINSAKCRNAALDHMLFYGPPGLGKTTIANIIANEIDVEIKQTTGPTIEKAGDLVGLLTSLNDNDILFIDEIHRIPRNIEEVLYSAMEDYFVNLTIGQGEQTKNIKIDLAHFTLIGATTKAGMISNPLRDRFGIVYKMENYNKDELSLIAKNSLMNLNIDGIDDNILLKIANSSRGTPRIVNNICKRIRDYVYSEKITHLTDVDIDTILELSQINKNGLTNTDIKILSTLNINSNKPIGVSTLASVTGEDEQTITDMNEPYLISEGYILKTPRGRILTEKGIEYIKSI